MSGASHAPMATWERLVSSILSFHTSLRLPNLTTREETPQPFVSYALFQGLIVFFIDLLMVEAPDFHCYSHVFENLRNETIPSDHAAARLVIQRPTNRGHQSKTLFPAGCPNIPSSVPYCSSFMTTTDSLLIHFVRWLNLKSSYTKPEDDET